MAPNSAVALGDQEEGELRLRGESQYIISWDTLYVV